MTKLRGTAKKIWVWLVRHRVAWKKLGFWMAVAVALFIGSGWFTLKITSVEGRSPTDIFNPNYGRDKDGNPLPDEFHGQLIGVLTPIAAYNGAGVHVDYITRGYGDTDVKAHKAAQIVITGNKAQALRIILNNVRSDAQHYDCNADVAPLDPASIDSGKDGGRRYFNPRKVVVGKREFRIMTFPATADGVLVKCWLVPDVGSETFTRRWTEIANLIPGLPLTFDPTMDASDETYAEKGVSYNDYVPVNALTVTMRLRGAEDMSFNGGVPDGNSDQYDTTRVLSPAGYTRVSWTDTVREQLRDIYLILIGTLIAIGVTAVIEAVRPYVDAGLEEEE